MSEAGERLTAYAMLGAGVRVTTTYTYEVEFRSPYDPALLVGVLRGAAAGWASCSNESDPLLDLADQIERQGYPKI